MPEMYLSGMRPYLYPCSGDFIFHNIIIHDKSSADIRFLGIDCLKTEMAVYAERVFIIFIARQPDGGITSFCAQVFQKFKCAGSQVTAAAVFSQIELAQKEAVILSGMNPGVTAEFLAVEDLVILITVCKLIFQRRI